MNRHIVPLPLGVHSFNQYLLSTHYGSIIVLAVEINPGCIHAKNQQESWKTKSVALQRGHRAKYQDVCVTSDRLLHGAITFQRTPASLLQAGGQLPTSTPCRSWSPVSTFQAFLEAVSPSRFYGWVNTAKRTHGDMQGNQYRIQFWIPWLDHFVFVIYPKFLQRPFILKKKWERPFLTFCSTVYSPVVNGDGISTDSRHNLPTVNRSFPWHSYNLERSSSLSLIALKIG